MRPITFKHIIVAVVVIAAEIVGKHIAGRPTHT